MTYVKIIGVPVLSAPDGTTVNSNLDKAVLLNTHFAKCFNTAFPPLVPPSVNTTDPPDDFLCTEDWVFNNLISLDVTKSSGPDEVSAHMLKFTAAVSALLSPPFLTCLFLSVVYLLNGKQLESRLFLRFPNRRCQIIFGPSPCLAFLVNFLRDISAL